MKVYILFYFVCLFILSQSCESDNVRANFLNEFELQTDSVLSVHRLSYKISEVDGHEIKVRAQRMYSPNDYKLIFDDKNKNVIVQLEYDRKDKYQGKTVYYLSAKGLCVKKEIFDKEDSLKKIIEKKYNEYNLVEEEFEYSASGLLLCSCKYFYKKGKCAEKRTFYSMGGVSSRVLYTYNENLHTIKERYYMGMYIPYREVVKKFNNKGLLLFECFYNLHNKDDYYEWKYSYTYDKKGNWIKRKDFYFLSLCYMIERNIEYFNCNNYETTE